MNKKEAEMEAMKKAKDAQHAAGKVNGMSGRDLVIISAICNLCSTHTHAFSAFLVLVQPRLVRG